MLKYKGIQIMAILNYTADSFYDGGQYNTPEKFFARAEQVILEGADILDIGVASTRPGAALINPEKEWQILKPLLVELRRQYPNKMISVDTYNAYTAAKSIEAGVDIINDISGGQFDENMFDIISQSNVFYVLMHTSDIPEKMQQKTNYTNVVQEVKNYLSQRIELLENKGFSNIIIDPGFGFGKTIEQNYQLLNTLDSFKELKKPILTGISRKSMIYKKLNTLPDSYEALIGTIALNAIAITRGANILRVHDVKENVVLKNLITIYGDLPG